jgi:hypothetical protein
MATDKKSAFPALSRRRLLRQAVATGAGLGALSAGGAGRLAFMGRALAADQPPIGTYPDCCSGSAVTIGATVPRTGAYAVQGEDELKGMELAVEHINEGHELIKKIAPKVTKGVLGKQVKLVVADSGAKPNQAVQEQQTFINDDKIALMTGSTSSAVAVALNKFAEREGALRHRHLRLQRHHREGLRALRLPPEFLRRDRGQRHRPDTGETLRQGPQGGVHDAGLHLWSHRHQVDERLSDQERQLDHGDQPGLAAGHAGLQPVPDQYRQLRRRVPGQREAAMLCCRSSRPSSSASCRR